MTEHAKDYAGLVGAWVFIDPTGCEHIRTNKAGAEKCAAQNPTWPVECLYRADAIEDLTARLAEAERERDEAREFAEHMTGRWKHLIHDTGPAIIARAEAAESALATVKAEREAMREGLKPFADFPDDLLRPVVPDDRPAVWEDGRWKWGGEGESSPFTIGDLRRARALTEVKQ